MLPNRSQPGNAPLLLDAWFPLRLAERWVTKQIGDAGLSADEIAFCSLLGSDATASELSELLGLPATTVSGIAARLERRGLVARTARTGDARTRIWRLTEGGQALRREVEARFAAAYRRLAGRLPTSESAIAAHLFALEWALREDLGVAHRTPPEYGASSGIELDGPPLTPTEAAELRRYADWLRVRRGTP